MARRAPLTDEEALIAVPGAPRSATARGDRVLLARVRAELEAGFDALATVNRAVTVFGSARTPRDHPDYRFARTIAARLGSEGHAIITGGGRGIMEAANRGARDAHSLSIGLIIDLPFDEEVNEYVDVPLRFHYFFTRKVMFVRYASAFVVFPGGFGTLDELFELAALTQTGKITSSPVVLVGRSYWEPLLAWLRERVLGSDKISPQDLELLAFADDEDEIRACVATAEGRI